MEGAANVRHPLQNAWTLWYDHTKQRLSKKGWGDHIKEVVTFDTVEDFWGVFNNLKAAADLDSGSNYHIFKKNIAPKWEDPANAHGGRWIYSNPSKEKQSALNRLWLNALLAVIGEVLEADESPDGEICGITLNCRKKEDRLCLWTRTAKDKEKTMIIGKKMKTALELADNKKISYRAHADGATGRNRPKKPPSRYVV